MVENELCDFEIFSFETLLNDNKFIPMKSSEQF